MVFKRRDRRPIWKIVVDFLWPKGGWTRAFHYVKHRVRRLPDAPERIARGIFAGVFTVFTPFYGLHFLTAAIIAKVMRGNILAALLATFVGNPLTYLPIAAFTDRDMDWHGLSIFYHEVFFPYMVGGIIPGLIAGIAGYYLSLPVIRAYQQRRKGALQERLKRIKSAKAAKAEGK